MTSSSKDALQPASVIDDVLSELNTDFDELECLLEEEDEARQNRNKQASLTNRELAKTLLCRVETQASEFLKSNETDPRAVRAANVAHWARLWFEQAPCNTGRLIKPLDGFENDIQILRYIIGLWNFAMKVLDGSLAIELVEVAQEMLQWRLIDIERYGEGDEEVKLEWNDFEDNVSIMLRVLEKAQYLGAKACTEMDDRNEEDDECQLPEWFGQDGYEEQTKQYLWELENISAELQEPLSTAEDNNPYEKTESRNSRRSSCSSTSTLISGKPLCSCEHECQLAGLPPLIRDEDARSEDMLTYSELNWREWEIEVEEELQSFIYFIVKCTKEYEATLHHDDPLNQQVFEYASVIVALGKGKAEGSQLQYGDNDLIMNFDTPGERLYLALKCYYCYLFPLIWRKFDYEVDSDVLEIARELIFWGEENGLVNSENEAMQANSHAQPLSQNTEEALDTDDVDMTDLFPSEGGSIKSQTDGEMQ